MGDTNHGTQTVSHKYYEEIVANNRNVRLVDIVPRGIYLGCYLERNSDIEVQMTVGTIEIGDNNVQVRVETSANAIINDTTLDSGTISPSTPYIALRWAYLASQINYMEIHAIASVASAQTNDIIVGKILFTGATITGFSYTERTFLTVQDLFLKPRQVGSGTTMYVGIRAGRVHTPTGYVIVQEGSVGPFVAPAAPNSRIDLIYIDDTGTPQIIQGTAAPVPTAPSYNNRLVIAEVTLVNGDTGIVASRIRDVRAFLVAPKSQRASTQVVGDTDIVAPAIVSDMAGMSATLTTTGTRLFCTFSATFWAAVTAATGMLYIYVDGVNKRKAKVDIYSHFDLASFQHLEIGLTPGSHTVKIKWSGTSLQQRGLTDSERVLIVLDLD